MKASLIKFKDFQLTREQMKEAKGGVVLCSTKYYAGGGEYVTVNGICGTGCSPEECEKELQAGAQSRGFISAQAYCWNGSNTNYQ